MIVNGYLSLLFILIFILSNNILLSLNDKFLNFNYSKLTPRYYVGNKVRDDLTYKKVYCLTSSLPIKCCSNSRSTRDYIILRENEYNYKKCQKPNCKKRCAHLGKKINRNKRTKGKSKKQNKISEKLYNILDSTHQRPNANRKFGGRKFHFKNIDNKFEADPLHVEYKNKSEKRSFTNRKNRSNKDNAEGVITLSQVKLLLNRGSNNDNNNANETLFANSRFKKYNNKAGGIISGENMETLPKYVSEFLRLCKLIMERNDLNDTTVGNETNYGLYVEVGDKNNVSKGTTVESFVLDSDKNIMYAQPKFNEEPLCHKIYNNDYSNLLDVNNHNNNTFPEDSWLKSSKFFQNLHKGHYLSIASTPDMPILVHPTLNINTEEVTSNHKKEKHIFDNQSSAPVWMIDESIINHNFFTFSTNSPFYYSTSTTSRPNNISITKPSHIIGNKKFFYKSMSVSPVTYQNVTNSQKTSNLEESLLVFARTMDVFPTSDSIVSAKSVFSGITDTPLIFTQNFLMSIPTICAESTTSISICADTTSASPTTCTKTTTESPTTCTQTTTESPTTCTQTTSESTTTCTQTTTESTTTCKQTTTESTTTCTETTTESPTTCTETTTEPPTTCTETTSESPTTCTQTTSESPTTCTQTTLESPTTCTQTTTESPTTCTQTTTESMYTNGSQCKIESKPTTIKQADPQTTCTTKTPSKICGTTQFKCHAPKSTTFQNKATSKRYKGHGTTPHKETKTKERFHFPSLTKLMNSRRTTEETIKLFLPISRKPIDPRKQGLTKRSFSRDFYGDDYLIPYDKYNAKSVEQYVDYLNRKTERMYRKHRKAMWDYETNITHLSRKKSMVTSLEITQYQRNLNEALKPLKFLTIANPSIERQIKLLYLPGMAILPDFKITEFEQVLYAMHTIYDAASVSEWHTPTHRISLEPVITTRMARSRDPDELRYYWMEWRKATGRRIRSLYEQYVELMNTTALANGFSDAGEMWTRRYETEDFMQILGSHWEDVRPLYNELHAYVRHGLHQTYGDITNAKDSGMIPVHLTGDIWGQNWKHLYDIVVPYRGVVNYMDVDLSDKGQLPPVVIPSMQKVVPLIRTADRKKYTPRQMVAEAEKMFHSLGFPELPPSFLDKSILVKPNVSEMICEPAVYDMLNSSDYRIKLCGSSNLDDFFKIHELLSKVEYYIQYQNLSFPFRDTANPGFGDAIAGALVLSAKSRRHMEMINFIPKRKNNGEDLNFLMKLALEKVAELPYSYIIDLWRHRVFQGQITSAEYNKRWWELRSQYQGITPPADRTEEDFDIGCKLEVAANKPFIKNFLSNLMEFQIHESLCKQAGHKGDLYNCDITSSMKAGKTLRHVMSMGASQHWRVAMKKLTGERRLQSGPLLRYFQPLYHWLKEKNLRDGQRTGWQTS